MLTREKSGDKDFVIQRKLDTYFDSKIIAEV